MSIYQIIKNFKENWKIPLPKSILSPTTLENIVFAIRWGRLWGGIPYEYDKTKGYMVVTKESARLWTIVTLIQAMHSGYFIGVVILTLINADNYLERKSLFDTAFGVIVTTISAAFLIADIRIGALQRNEYCSFVNSAMQYYVFLKETYTNQFGAKWRNGCEELMVALRVTVTVLPFLSIIYFFQHPGNSIYVISLIPRDSIFYTLAYIPYGCSLFFLQIAGCSTILGICFPTLGIVFCFLAIIDEMKPRKLVYRTKPSFRKPETLRITVRILQLLCTQVNMISKQILMAEQTLVTYTGVVCIFSSIRFWEQLTYSAIGMLVLTALSGVGVWLTVLTISAHVYASAEKTLNSWRNYSNWASFETKQMQKYRKSVRPLQLEFGGFYYIRPKKILSFWNTMVWLVVRALLTFPDTHHQHY